MPWTNTLTGSTAFTTKEEVDYIRAVQGAAAGEVLRWQGKVPINAQAHPNISLGLYHLGNIFGIGVKGAQYARDRSIMCSTKPSFKKSLGRAYYNATQDQAIGKISRGWTSAMSRCRRAESPDKKLQKAVKERFEKIPHDKDIQKDLHIDSDCWKTLDIDALGDIARFAAPYICRLEDELTKLKTTEDALKAATDTGSPELKAAFMQFARHASQEENVAYLPWVWKFLGELEQSSKQENGKAGPSEFELCAAYHQFISKGADKQIHISDEDRKMAVEAIEEALASMVDDEHEDYLPRVTKAINDLRRAEDDYDNYKDGLDRSEKEKAWKKIAHAKAKLEKLRKESRVLSDEAREKVREPLKRTFDAVYEQGSTAIEKFHEQVRIDAPGAAGYSHFDLDEINVLVYEKWQKLSGELQELGLNKKGAHLILDRIFRIWEDTPFVEKLRPGVLDQKLAEIDKAAKQAKLECQWRISAKNPGETYAQLRKTVLDLWRKDWLENGGNWFKAFGKYGKEIYYDTSSGRFAIDQTKWYKKLYNMALFRGKPDPNRIKNISKLIETRLDEDFSWLKSKDGETLPVGELVVKRVFSPKWYNFYRHKEKRGADVGTFQKIDAEIVKILTKVGEGSYRGMEFSEATSESAKQAARVFAQGWESRSQSKNVTNWQKKASGGIRLEQRLEEELQNRGDGSSSERFWKKFKPKWLAHGLTLRTLAAARQHLAANDVLGDRAKEIDFRDLYQTVDLENKFKAHAGAQIGKVERNLSEEGLKGLDLDQGSIKQIRGIVAPALDEAGDAVSEFKRHLDDAGLGGEPELYVIFRLFQSSMRRLERAYREVSQLDDISKQKQTQVLLNIKQYRNVLYDLAMAAMPLSVRDSLEDRLSLYDDISTLAETESRLRDGTWDLNAERFSEKSNGLILRAARENLDKAPAWLEQSFGGSKYEELRTAYNRHISEARSALEACQTKEFSDAILASLITHLEIAQTLNERLMLIHRLAAARHRRKRASDEEMVKAQPWRRGKKVKKLLDENKDTKAQLKYQSTQIAKQSFFLREVLRDANQLNDLRNCFRLLGTGRKSDDEARIERLRKVLERHKAGMEHYQLVFQGGYQHLRYFSPDQGNLDFLPVIRGVETINSGKKLKKPKDEELGVAPKSEAAEPEYEPLELQDYMKLFEELREKIEGLKQEFRNLNITYWADIMGGGHESGQSDDQESSTIPSKDHIAGNKDEFIVGKGIDPAHWGKISTPQVAPRQSQNQPRNLALSPSKTNRSDFAENVDNFLDEVTNSMKNNKAMKGMYDFYLEQQDEQWNLDDEDEYDMPVFVSINSAENSIADIVSASYTDDDVEYSNTSSYTGSTTYSDTGGSDSASGPGTQKLVTTSPQLEEPQSSVVQKPVKPSPIRLPTLEEAQQNPSLAEPANPKVLDPLLIQKPQSPVLDKVEQPGPVEPPKDKQARMPVHDDKGPIPRDVPPTPLPVDREGWSKTVDQVFLSLDSFERQVQKALEYGTLTAVPYEPLPDIDDDHAVGQAVLGAIARKNVGARGSESRQDARGMINRSNIEEEEEVAAGAE